MGIQERNLPVAESLDEGAMVRIVDGEGHSKNIDAGDIGGGSDSPIEVVNIEVTETDNIYTVTSVSHTYSEIQELHNNGKILLARCACASRYGSLYWLLPVFNVGAYDTAVFQEIIYSDSTIGNLRLEVSENNTSLTYTSLCETN